MNVIGALQHLASECGETTQAAVKYIQHGPTSTNPNEHPPKTNRRALEEEVGDVMALIALLTEEGVLRKKKVQARLNVKLESYRRKYA
ncbi:hypothetical protein AMP1_23 [Burkholderia phage AMP1]|uniref:Uncharacterized protein n=5 Tax=Ampunavirus BpAMP1 TaxID=2733589 RepID=A0A5C2IH62_9CAUD|nr:nucleoside triphosphate pyrophosphohydrolase [Burkholderia phage Bp-AMP1]QEP52850.1 hypothetical protein AMP1_23 [Burkholderia phage AMP1]CDL65181.1 hypothetical protein [Burkholderia phage Bp-AMP2]CDL65221.1 hypothetical protein [Burkholderia phage Bp-AMP3]CDL65251.1 hypothetical protein [Burkholderia phage Bp-AMP4]CDK30095.1 hypothetical protein [Burkholderia phage Bp-AMP1]